MDLSKTLRLIESHSLNLTSALSSSTTPSLLLNRFIYRNPSIYHPLYLTNYELLNDTSKVKLFLCNNALKDIILQESYASIQLQTSILHEYFTEDNILSPKYVKVDKETLNSVINNFESELCHKFMAVKFEKCINNSIDFDTFIFQCIKELILNKGTEKGDLFSDAIKVRLSCDNVLYYQKGAELIDLLTKEKNMDNYEVVVFNYELNVYDKQYCNLPEKYLNYKPRTSDECIDKIVENKNIELTKYCMLYLYHLIPQTTLRSLNRMSKKTYSTILKFNTDKIEHLNLIKVKILSQLIRYNFCNVIKLVVETVYEQNSTKKIIIMGAVSECIEFLALDDVILLMTLLSFNYKKIKNDRVKNVYGNLLVRVMGVFNYSMRLKELCIDLMNKIEN